MEYSLTTGTILKSSAIAVVLFVTVKIVKNRNRKRLLRKKVFQKRDEVCIERRNLEQCLTSNNEATLSTYIKRKEIVELEISILLQKLKEGSLSCLEVLRAYQTKALEVTHEYNCITEFIKEAEEWANLLDADAALGKKKGPLHGLPFSVKDNIDVNGYDSTIGMAQFLFQPSTEDAALVIALKKLGAIPFCKTNVPQTNLSFGCSNPVWGLTTNPWDKERTPGGSTGGEACLIAAGGSPFGIGGDVGGSIRFPAAFCGIYSIKPTHLRLSFKGFKRATVGNVGIEPVPGIMTRDSQTLITITKLLLDKNYLHVQGDPDVLPIPWNEQMFNQQRKLKIGYYEDDGYFPTTPGIRRAVQTAKTKLESLGHELIPFVPPRPDYVVNSFVSILSADQGRYLMEALSDEKIDPVLNPTKLSICTPYIVKRLLRPVIAFFAPRLIPVYTGSGGHHIRETHQFWSEILKKKEYKEEFLAYWRELNLDICISPCFASPAPLSKDVGKLTPAFSYSALYNFIDFPAGIIPIDKENLEDQSKLDINYQYPDIVCKLIKKNTKGAVGMPLSIQVIGLPYQEEMVLRGINIINSALLQ